MAPTRRMHYLALIGLLQQNRHTKKLKLKLLLRNALVHPEKGTEKNWAAQKTRDVRQQWKATKNIVSQLAQLLARNSRWRKKVSLTKRDGSRQPRHMGLLIIVTFCMQIGWVCRTLRWRIILNAFALYKRVELLVMIKLCGMRSVQDSARFIKKAIIAHS